MTKTRITILCENLVGRTVGAGEHGFSAFIETDEGNYLFDTGGGRTVVENSLSLNKDLRTVKKIFLSHGHHDHTGRPPPRPQPPGAGGRRMFIRMSSWTAWPCGKKAAGNPGALPG